MGTMSGWENYETWRVASYVHNSADAYAACADDPRALREAVESDLLDTLYLSPGQDGSLQYLVIDLLHSALDAVDWQEIASALSDQ